MRYLHARDGLDFMLLILNGAVAMRIVWRLAFPDVQHDSTASLWSRMLRTAIAMSYATIAVRILGGWYLTPFEPSELIPNLLVCAVVEVYRGDLRAFWETLREARANRKLASRRIIGGKSHGS
jgi:hypothetical protein